MKSTRLAKDGGHPIRKTYLPYSRQWVDEADIKLVTEALRGDIITRGPFVEKFEAAIAEWTGMPHAIAFSSATAALHATMAMFQVGPGKKVVTTPITFAATANAVRYCQGEVVFKDVEFSTMNLDAKTLGDLSGASVVTAVDFAGNPCDYDQLKGLKRKFGFALVDDASHSLGARYQGRNIGAEADVSIFSFHPVKSITTGEGGVAVVRDSEHAKFLRQFRGHGIVRDGRPGYYEQTFLGYNYCITDLQCALGLSQLKKLSSFVKRRQQIADKYLQAFKKMPDLILPSLTPQAESSWHLFPLRIKFENLSVHRDEFLRALIAENIGANVHYIPVHFHPYYRDLGYQKGICPIAEDAYAREISIPLFQGMSDEDADDVILAIEKLLNLLSR